MYHNFLEMTEGVKNQFYTSSDYDVIIFESEEPFVSLGHSNIYNILFSQWVFIIKRTFGEKKMLKTQHLKKHVVFLQSFKQSGKT